MIRRFLSVLLVLAPLAAHAGLDPRMTPAMDYYSEYVSGGGVVYGNLYMRGNDIYLDTDDDSRLELGTDDEVQLYLNSSLFLDLDEFGIEYTPVAITESADDDRALYINPTLNDTGAPDGTETYVVMKVELTETDKTGWNSVDLLVLSVDTDEKFRIDDAGTIHGDNAETLDNDTDGSWCIAGAGGTYNENACFDLEGDNLIEISSGTGVTTWDWGAIGLACGTADLSEGNITNTGDVQLDSLTADGTVIQTNSSTLVLQQNADVASGGFLTINSETDAELTASSGSQIFAQVAPEILQTGTAGYTALEVDTTESSVGTGNNSLLDLQVANASKLRVDTSGKTHGANAETLDNGTDGSWRMTGVGGTYNEDIEIDLEGDNLVELKSSTGVTLWDWGAIGLAAGTADLSEGNLTNAGDLQADSLTADGTALQTNSSTLTLQQNADLASGNFATFNSETDAELTASSGAQSFVQIAPEIEQSGTAAYTALEVDVTESGTGSGTSYLLDLQVADASKLQVGTDGKVHGANAETLDNGTDGSWIMTGVGGTYNEALEIDLEGDNLVEIKTSTGVTTIDTGTIGLACGAIDLSEGNLTNGGDLQIDSLTADGTALQVNASTITLQQNADVSSGNVMTLNSETDAELTASSGAQSFVQIAPEVLQTGTAGYTALEIDVTESGVGSGDDYLLDLQVADASKFSVSSAGAVSMGGGMSLGGNLDMNSNDITELGTLHGSNSETLANGTDGSWIMTGVGGTYNESLEIDLEGDNLVEVKTSTGVTLVDYGAIGLAGGSFDASEGNLTNVGDVQLDSLTADGTALQTNSSTLVLQQNADLASGNMCTIDSETDAELTASSGSQSFVKIAPEIDQSSTAGYVALEIDVTESGTGSGTNSLLDLQVADASKFSVSNTGAVVAASSLEIGGNLDMNSNNITELGTLGFSNSETIANGSDGTLTMTGVGGSNNEDLSFDFESTADTIGVSSSTSVATVDFGSIGLACGTADVSDGNITNVGDVALDSLTADDTAIQANATTITLQQNADASSGNVITLDSHADAELTASSGSQSFLRVAPEVLQTGSGAYTALEVDVTESSEGSATDYLLDLQVADASKASVDSDGALVCASTGDFGGDLTLDNSGSSVNSPMVSLKGDSSGTEVEGQIQLMHGADPYVRISVDDDDATPAMTAVIDIHDAAISFPNDNTTDIGASGANRPKDYYGAGSITCGGSMSCVGGDFGDGAITNVGDIALDSITADGSEIAVASTMDLQGNDLILDSDGDSKLDLSTDDTLKLELNSGLVATFATTGLTLDTSSAITLTLNGTASSKVLFGDNGAAAPALTTRSAGTKLVLKDNVSASYVDYALGMDTNILWLSIAGDTSAFYFKWYAKTTNIMTLRGDGNLNLTGDLSVGDNAIVNVGDIDVDSVSADGSTVDYMDVNILELTQEDVGATCTLGQVRIDTGGATVEFCYCKATDDWGCAALGALTD
ncbi:MAG: hypothetical protein AMJ46_12675 [Latescibacteria bacterium DG_63]|nr:MAG: hypothetical protein AMJ46_12675 [Latescibacteria bacterium DG_63]